MAAFIRLEIKVDEQLIPFRIIILITFKTIKLFVGEFYCFISQLKRMHLFTATSARN